MRNDICDIAWERVLASPRKAKRPLHVQLAQSIINCIEDNEIAGGVRLPSSRNLAKKLRTGRNTVIQAYNVLIEQGYLISRERSGIYVAPTVTIPLKLNGKYARRNVVDWQGRLTLNARASVELQPSNTAITHDFAYGQFDLTLFPMGHWRECERAALGVVEVAHWGRDMIDEDDVELVDQLRRNVLPHHGIWAKRNEILICLGGQEGRYLVTQLLASDDTRVGIENPGMPDVKQMLELTRARLKYLSVDDNGLKISSQLDECDVVFTTVGHQCPTAAVMPLRRRNELLAKAQELNIVLVEDTFETEILQESEELRSLKSLDDSGRVIYIGSLSKQVVPGLRVGFVVACEQVIQQLRVLRRLIHRHPPGNNQRALGIFIERGYYRSCVKRVSNELDRRSERLEGALRKWFPDFRWRHQSGASTFWITTPSKLSGVELASAARDNGVLIQPGRLYFHKPPQPDNAIRLAVSSTPVDRIDEGVQKLAHSWRSLR